MIEERLAVTAKLSGVDLCIGQAVSEGEGEAEAIFGIAGHHLESFIQSVLNGLLAIGNNVFQLGLVIWCNYEG